MVSVCIQIPVVRHVRPYKWGQRKCFALSGFVIFIRIRRNVKREPDCMPPSSTYHASDGRCLGRVPCICPLPLWLALESVISRSEIFVHNAWEGSMLRFLATVTALVLSTAIALAQAPAASPAVGESVQPGAQLV